MTIFRQNIIEWGPIEMRHGICLVIAEHKIRVIPKYENITTDYLVIAAGKFKTPTAGQRKYKIDIVNRHSIPNNSK